MLFPAVRAVSAALAAAVDDADLRCRGIAHMPAGMVQPPCVLFPRPGLRRLSFGGGSWSATYRALVVPGSPWDRAGDAELDDLATGVWAALEVDTTLGGVCSSLVVRETESEPAVITIGDATYPTITLVVEVFVAGTTTS